MLAALCLPTGGHAWEPDPTDDRQVKAAGELDRYLASEKVRTYIDQAYGYAILPNFVRVAAGLGFNYGSGFVIEQNALVGKTSNLPGHDRIHLWLGSPYSQIIIFP